MINIPYRASTFVGRRNRRRFMERAGSLPPVTPPREVPVNVFALSGERDWPEQVASIRSFLRFVGAPQRYVVVSDGSHSAQSISKIEQIHPRVLVRPLESFIQQDLSERIRTYAAQHFLGKKLALLLSLPVDGVTIYSDSDILYFPGATEIARLLDSCMTVPRYLLDSWPSLDPRLLVGEFEKDSPVNGGFLVLNRPPDWKDALSRLERMQGDCMFFTEQTLVHLAMKAAGAQPLPPDRFILRADDQFGFSDTFASERIVLRHYVSSIRTKMWHHTGLFL